MQYSYANALKDYTKFGGWMTPEEIFRISDNEFTSHILELNEEFRKKEGRNIPTSLFISFKIMYQVSKGYQSPDSIEKLLSEKGETFSEKQSYEWNNFLKQRMPPRTASCFGIQENHREYVRNEMRTASYRGEAPVWALFNFLTNIHGMEVPTKLTITLYDLYLYLCSAPDELELDTKNLQIALDNWHASRSSG